MGEVYKATDTNLKRAVAIKVLPASVASDAERLARFQREAEVLAALNHPNIAAIYGLERSGATTALVMELVEGPTLADRIAQGAIPIDEALPIAKQIAEALEAAHEQGIIHRDLKPANIKVRGDGTVKVLDFGLAKAMEPDAGSSPSVSMSPTLSLHATMAGVILGTAAYMSPEQARGKTVDKRTDIWAFGAVLYEMLTGKRAFEGEDVADILAHVLTHEPNWDKLPRDVPPRVRELLRLCLQKDMRKRRRDAGDVVIDIDQISAERPQDVVSLRSAGNARLAWFAAAVFAVSAAVAIGFALRSSPVAPEMRLEIGTPSMGSPAQFALSPDGLSVVFVASSNGPQRLWLRRLDKPEAQPLTGTEGAGFPFWSADSRSIGFSASNKLFRTDLDGGPSQALADAPAYVGAAWNRDGDILFAPSLTGPILRVSASGGPSTAVTRLDPPHVYGHLMPRFLPDGRHFLFFAAGSPDAQGIYLGSLDGGNPKRLSAADAHAEYVEPGYVLFINQGTLLARRLDLARGELTGQPQTVAASVPYIAALGFGSFSASANGRIAYRFGPAARRQLMWHDRAGGRSDSAAEPDPNELQSAELSPDGRRVALDRTVQGNRDIWLLELQRGSVTRFTFDPAQDGLPVWSPDSTQIAFESKRKGPYDLYLKAAGAAVSERPLLESIYDKWPLDWSKDGAYLLYFEANPKTAGDLMALPMKGTDRKPIVIAGGPFAEQNGQFSPDGRWVAYQTNESRRDEIVVQSFPNPSMKWQVSNDGGVQPRWSRDGKELYFIAPDFKMMAAPITVSGATSEPGKPAPLFQTRIASVPKPQYSIAADGRFLVNEQTEESADTSITLIFNWHP